MQICDIITHENVSLLLISLRFCHFQLYHKPGTLSSFLCIFFYFRFLLFSPKYPRIPCVSSSLQRGLLKMGEVKEYNLTSPIFNNPEKQVVQKA